MNLMIPYGLCRKIERHGIPVGKSWGIDSRVQRLPPESAWPRGAAAAAAAFLNCAATLEQASIYVLWSMSLWRSDDPGLWDAFRGSYAAALAAASKATPAKKSLVQLDMWWRNELAPAIKGRDPAYIMRSELSHVMKWKLTRGKMRPLQKLVDGNDDGDVRRLSTEAFKIVGAHPPARFLRGVTLFKGPQRP